MKFLNPPDDPATLRPPAETPRAIRFEIAIVLLLTLGMSGLRAVLSYIEKEILANRTGTPLSSQSVAVVAPQSSVEWIDLSRQILSITSGLVGGLLGVYLLWRAGVDLRTTLGLDRKQPGRDLARGVGLAALIGIPGLGLYLVAHAFGYAVTVVASSLADTWWRIPVSILAALENGFLEEILVVGYLITRLQHLRVRWWVAVLCSAALRGSYHLYQGPWAFVGNAVMGTVFALYFLRYRRLWPLVAAHALIDIVVFVGYPLLQGTVSWLP